MEKKSPAPRVLVVDDEALIRWSIVETLTELGYSVVEAGDGESALRTLADGSKLIDVILPASQTQTVSRCSQRSGAWHPLPRSL